MYCDKYNLHGRGDLVGVKQAGLITPMQGAALKDAGFPAGALTWVEALY